MIKIGELEATFMIVLYYSNERLAKQTQTDHLLWAFIALNIYYYKKQVECKNEFSKGSEICI